MRLQRLVLAVAAAGVLVAGAAAASPKPRTLPTSAPVSGLAADGSTVAVATAWSSTHCERVVVWNPVRASLQGIGKGGRCDETSTGRGIVGQAVAGTRVAWIADGGGNQHDAILYTASLSKPSVTHRLLMATRDTDSGIGDSVGALQGAGSLLVYATWSICSTEAAFKACPAGVTPDTVYGAKLWRIDGLTGRRMIASAPDGLFPVAVAGGRILVARGDGTAFELRGADGHVIQTYQPDAEVLQATLGTKELVLAVRTPLNPPLSKAGIEFRVYNLATGALERTLPVPASAQKITTPRCWSYPAGAPAVACVSPPARLRFANADATRFAYVLDTAVHVARLNGSKDTALMAAGRAPVFAALAGTGLVYAYKTGGGVQGRVQYLPSP